MNTAHEYLLDTHALIWLVEAPSQLSAAVQEATDSGRFVVSAASFWEMMLKAARHDAFVSHPRAWWSRYVVETNLPVLAIEHFHIKHLEMLPAIHKDPFDRILVCQSLHHGLKLITKDRSLQLYQNFVSVLW